MRVVFVSTPLSHNEVTTLIEKRLPQSEFLDLHAHMLGF
jgi:hypothetical protein